jgi:gas vesicle protein
MSRDSEERNVTLNFLAGLGVGALVGAVAALLLAPKSGKDTREDIRAAADDLRHKADKVIADLSVSSEELVRKSKEIIESTKSKVQHAIETGKQAVSRKRGEECEEAEPADG